MEMLDFLACKKLTPMMLAWVQVTRKVMMACFGGKSQSETREIAALYIFEALIQAVRPARMSMFKWASKMKAIYRYGEYVIKFWKVLEMQMWNVMTFGVFKKELMEVERARWSWLADNLADNAMPTVMQRLRRDGAATLEEEEDDYALQAMKKLTCNPSVATLLKKRKIDEDSECSMQDTPSIPSRKAPVTNKLQKVCLVNEEEAPGEVSQKELDASSKIDKLIEVLSVQSAVQTQAVRQIQPCKKIFPTKS